MSKVIHPVVCWSWPTVLTSMPFWCIWWDSSCEVFKLAYSANIHDVIFSQLKPGTSDIVCLVVSIWAGLQCRQTLPLYWVDWAVHTSMPSYWVDWTVQTSMHAFILSWLDWANIHAFILIWLDCANIHAFILNQLAHADIHAFILSQLAHADIHSFILSWLDCADIHAFILSQLAHADIHSFILSWLDCADIHAFILSWLDCADIHAFILSWLDCADIHACLHTQLTGLCRHPCLHTQLTGPLLLFLCKRNVSVDCAAIVVVSGQKECFCWLRAVKAMVQLCHSNDADTLRFTLQTLELLAIENADLICRQVSRHSCTWSAFAGYDNKDCPGQVTYLVGQVKISVVCLTRQGVIIFFIDSIIFQFKH